MTPDAMHALVHEYARRLDGGDFDGVASLFDAAEWHSPGGRVRRGRDEVREMYDPVILYPDGTPRTQHVITNVVVEVDGDAARSRSTFTVLQATDGLALQVILAGRYLDTFEHVGDAWRFRVRSVQPDFVGDLSRHMRNVAIA